MPPMSFGQEGPAWGPGGSTPDWTALAEAAERKRARRRRLLLVGGGTLATAAVAGIVAAAVMTENGSGPSDKPSQSLPTPDDLPSGTDGPEPSFDEKLPPAPPEDYLKDPEKDKAPLSEDTLFPQEEVTLNGRAYALAAKDASPNCTAATQGGLGAVLEKYGCDRLFRATYERDGLAFTVGIAVFGSEAKASSVKEEYRPNVAALAGGDVPAYCRTVVCRTTVNSLGRYAFFSIAGHINGRPAGDDDEAAKRTALDGSNLGYGRVLQRGKDQSEADAGTR